MAVVSSGAGSGALSFDPIQSNRAPVGCSTILEDAHRLLLEGQVATGMDVLMSGLSELRASLGPDAWELLCRHEIIPHPISELVWQDPFTCHSFHKPRGYPGDAALLDYIYGYTPPPSGTSPLGEAIFRDNVQRQAPRSVRSRMQVLAQQIDDAASRFDQPRILSIACGHLREAGLSKALSEGRIGELVALDQDPESLAEVERAYGNRGVRVAEHSVRAILSQKVQFQDLHLVYAAGLYDYLSERVAARLTRIMFDMLAPGGRLLVANFAPCLADIGYIESYMGWKLIYREPEQMTALAHDIGSGEWASQHLFWDEFESIIFLEITKRAAVNGSLVFAPGLRSARIPGLANVTFAGASASPHSRAEGSSNGNGNGHPHRHGNGVIQ